MNERLCRRVQVLYCSLIVKSGCQCENIISIITNKVFHPSIPYTGAANSTPMQSSTKGKQQTNHCGKRIDTANEITSTGSHGTKRTSSRKLLLEILVKLDSIRVSYSQEILLLLLCRFLQPVNLH